MPDVKKALNCLRSDQLLIVSVMGSYEDYTGPDVVADFVAVARMAEEAGAPVIELNLSCPNTVDPSTGTVKQSLICESVESTHEIVKSVRSALRPEKSSRRRGDADPMRP
jgi:dihydroorotate dehydrogenase